MQPAAPASPAPGFRLRVAAPMVRALRRSRGLFKLPKVSSSAAPYLPPRSPLVVTGIEYSCGGVGRVMMQTLPSPARLFRAASSRFVCCVHHEGEVTPSCSLA